MFSKFRLIFNTFSKNERLFFFGAILIFLVSLSARGAIAFNEKSEFKTIAGGSYKEGIVGQPQAINPLISSNPSDLDISALVYSNLFELLSTYENGNNGRVYNLNLKEGLKWSDGAPLTSDDVIFTLKTIQDPETRSPLKMSWQGVVPERISELQVRLTLAAPYVFFENNLKKLPILPKHIFGSIPPANLKLSGYNLEPVGSGPYKFKSISIRKDGFIEEIALQPNENYYGEKPLIKNFYFKFYEDDEKLSEAFLTRKINGFGSLTPLDTKKYENPNTIIRTVPMPRYYAIFINPNLNPALKKKELRQALNFAIDKEKIAQEIFGKNAKALDGPMADDSPLNYKPDEARALLTNQKLELNLIVPQIDFLVKTAELVRSFWLAAGVEKVNIIALAPDDLVSNVIKSRNYELLIFGNVLENVPDLFPFWHSSQRFDPGLNLSLYQNNRVDALLEKIRLAPISEERQSLLKDVLNIIRDDTPAIFLYSLPYTYIHTKNLTGFAFSENDFLTTPSERFKNVNNWSVLKVRVLK